MNSNGSNYRFFADLPGIVSGDRITFLDPHEEYFRDEKGRGNSVISYYFDEDLLQERPIRDQFMPFHDIFGCNLQDAQDYDGTLFRFPLRKMASELSAEKYTEEKVLKLFNSLQEEASVVLLFLKNICTINLYERSENGEIERSFRVEISENSRKEVIKIRQEFLSKAAAKPDICDSKYVMNVRVLKDSISTEYQWLVVNQIGSSVKCVSDMASKEKLPPWVGMALPLHTGSSRMDTGRIFCFLPLPPEVDCITGLPVHVHGAFALTDNRRGLEWPGADNQSSTALWNKLLLENVAIDVYSKLLYALLQNSPFIEIDESARSQLVYSTLPCKTKVKGHWQVILDPLFQKLSKEDWKLFLAIQVNGKSWVRLQDAIVDRLDDNNARKTVLKVLQGCSQPVITNVPAHVLNIIDNYFPPSCYINPRLLRSVLRQNDLEVPREDKIKLLEFILEDDPRDDLIGVPLLPLANLEFTKFAPVIYDEDSSSSVFIATQNCPKSVLPNFDHRILGEDLPMAVKNKLEMLASDAQSSSITQLFFMNQEIVLQNLRSCLPVEWFNNISDVVQWVPESVGHPSESWLEEIWSWIHSNFSDSLESFDGLPLIQLPHQSGMTCKKLGILSKQSKFIFASDISGNSLPNVVVNLLKASGCTVLPKQSSNLRHSDINAYIASASPTGVMTVLCRTSFEKAKEQVRLCTSDELLKLREFLSRIPTNLDSAQRNLLVRLPLFNTLDGSSVAIQTDNETLSVAEPNFTYPNDFCKSNQIISSADTHTQQLLKLLDIKILNSAEVFVKFLFPDISAGNVYGFVETAKIMLWIIEKLVDFTWQRDGFIEEIKNLPFVPTNECKLFRPSELYDPGDTTLLDLFHSEPNKFPKEDEYREVHVVSVLRKHMGLLTIDKLTANDLLEVAATINTSSQVASSNKLQALVKILNSSPDYLNHHVNSGVPFKSELLKVKWLPRATKFQNVCPRFPKSMRWYDCDAQFFSPPELCDKSHALVVGSSMPILNVDLSEKVREGLGLLADPPLKQVVAQLQSAVQVWSNFPDRKASVLFKEMIIAIYSQLASCSNESVMEQLSSASMEDWIWHGAGFCSPSQVALEIVANLDLRPQLFILPEELKHDMKLQQFFLKSGVHVKFLKEDIISVLPALKQKHETSDLSTVDIEKDLKLCRSILEWLAESDTSLSEKMKENLFFPVENKDNSLVLLHYKNCAYCDVDWLRRGDSFDDIPVDHPLIHNKVPIKVAVSLGVPTLSSCVLSAETLDFEFEKSGPNEPITTRIHNILEEYKEGVGVFKELIQNADDAGASKVRFLLDWRVGPKDRLLSSNMSECQGPALWAYNDGLFSDSDFENINKLAGATKKKDISTIGRFGLGFNAVYHLTDVPSFVSREYFVIFDPNCQHLSNTDASQPGMRINLKKTPKPLKVYGNQFQPYDGIFDCNMKYSDQGSFYYKGTLFRFPFRTLVQAGRSKICQKVYNEKEKVKSIVESLRESASLLLLYTENVIEVELFELNNNQIPEQMQLILSMKKTGNSQVSSVPFVKSCSNWWEKRMRDEIISNECPSKSQVVTISIDESTGSSSSEIVHSHQEESWLISSCMGKESSSDLALSPQGQEYGLMPFAETAVKLNCFEQATLKTPQVVSGEAFCFLPLSIQTGLPVHINGYFAITSNRRDIWKSGTTEHDKPFEGEWNAKLLSDAIACSYVQLLLEIKSTLPGDDTNSLQQILPCYDTLHSSKWEPLAKSIYDKVVNDSLAIFWGNEKWLDINSGFILDDDLRRAPEVISTMNALDEVALNLSEEVCKSFIKAGHEFCINSRTLTLERFFRELFFPNISRISHELREPMVRYGLDCILKGHEELEKMFKENQCILNDNGELKQPKELFEPNDSLLQELFFLEAGKFVNQDLAKDSSSVSVLNNLGLRNKAMISTKELLNVAKMVSLSEYSELLIKKSRALITILQSEPDYLSQHVDNTNLLKQELRCIKWLPRARSPPESCRYPEKMPWFDVEETFYSPNEVRCISQALLIGSCMPVVEGISENLLTELSIVSEIPLEKVVEQLSNAVQIWNTDPEIKTTSLFAELILTIYQHLAEVPSDLLLRTLKLAKLTRWIWHGAGFCSSYQIAMEMFLPFDLRPQLFFVPEEVKDDMKLQQFFLKSGVRVKFTKEDIISVLPALKEKHETSDVSTVDIEKDLKLCRSILEWLAESDTSLSEKMKENLFFPVENKDNSLVLLHYKNCAYCDVDWLRRGDSFDDIPVDHPLIHNKVPIKVAVSLGVPTLSSCVLSAETLDFEFEKSGPNEPITTRIHNILEEYKEGVGVFKELIQNADDAGASKVRFLVDWRVGPKDRLLSSNMSECQGPALWAYNDGLFSDSDFENINKLAGATKKKDISTIGRFGLGFNAVYHLTDVPSFVSREYFVIFDPNCQHLSNTDASQPGMRINLKKTPKPLKVYGNQFQPYDGIFDCNMKYSDQGSFYYKGTLFRFPFRTLVQAGRSKICQKVYNEKEKVKSIVESLRESASLLLLYTENVIEVELFELNNNQIPEQMQLILSMKKTGNSQVSSVVPFVKSCSNWWEKRMRDEIISNECPSKSQVVTISIDESTGSSSGEIVHSHQEESWLISSCMGKESSSDLALSPQGQEYGLMPFAETAVKLNCFEQATLKTPQVVSGEAFCFLPLSIQTGLPVHINGYFAITSNRRDIWKGGTTEHDKPFEGEWNAKLLSDAIACSYVQLLLEIKSTLPGDDTNSLQQILPCYDTLHSSTWEPLAKSIYDKVVNESLAIFWGNEKWLDINSGYILDDDLRRAPEVISTMKALGEVALNLIEEVCKSFIKAGHEFCIKSRTLTLERFFRELFFPNISTISHELREPMVRYGLDCILKGHEELEKMFRENQCILNDNGELKQPKELFDPSDSLLQELFYLEAGKFLNQALAKDSSSVSVLKNLGLRNKAMISTKELLNVAKVVSLSEYSELLIKKSRALITILQSEPDYLSQHVDNTNSLKQELRCIKWLTRARSPPESCRYPKKMPWFDVEETFCSPNEVRGTSQALLIGSCMPVVEGISENLLIELSTVSDIPLEKVVEQLSNVVQIWHTDPEIKTTSLFEELILTIYQHLAEVPSDLLLRTLKQAKLTRWIWHGAGFCSSYQIAMDMFLPFDLRPQLFFVPKEVKDDLKLQQFFLKSGVRVKFTKEDIISVLPALKEKHESPDVSTVDIEKDLKLCRSILEWLAESDTSLSEKMKENLYFPVEKKDNSLVLLHYKNCAYCDVDWLRRGESFDDIPEDHPLIHNKVPIKVAVSLGVPTLSSCVLSAETLDFEFEKSGPNEPITTRIHNILEEYKEGVGVFKELIQNADDAGASKVRFLVDWRVGPKDRLLSSNMSECQGPALWAYNDGLFSDSDFENINKLAGATKKKDISTIGRFGLGFNAVYHLTDVPSFVSREYFVIFDPNCQHLSNTDASQPGMRINLKKTPKPLKIYENQFQPYDGIFDCNMKYSDQGSFYYKGTLFRFPFRTLVQAGRSKICQKVYNEKEKVKSIVESLRESASLLLLYTENVIEVELFELNNNQIPEQMQLILSMKKTGNSQVSSVVPFVKSCSNWWEKRMRDEAILNPCPSKSQVFTISIDESTGSSSGEIVHSHQEESWLISSCMGKESSCDLALSPQGQEYGLMPFAETAVKLNCFEQATLKTPQVVSGEAFCFLPLSIQTGLPVHINGYFAITSNRRDIWKGGTTEHDKPFEGEWNAKLLSDAIACSYVQLLLEIKSTLPGDDTNSLQQILPCYDTLHSSTWEPLAKSIYDKVVNESLAIFWGNEKWLDINSGYILDDDLRRAPEVISTMKALGEVALNLIEEVCKSFIKAGHEFCIKSRTLTLERFFRELFFPNISTISHELREPMVRYGLDCILKGHEELEEMFRENQCILNDNGELKQPKELFDPSDSLLQELFYLEAGKFLNQALAKDSSSVSVLKNLGLRNKAMISTKELLNVAKVVSLSEYSELLIKKSRALIAILQSEPDFLSKKLDNNSSLKQELLCIKWVPRARSPPESCRYPEKMPWLDVKETFCSPNEVRGTSQALLIGSCMPVVEVISENLLSELNIVSEIPLEKVVEQLCNAVQFWHTDPQIKPASLFEGLILTIYQYLSEIPADSLRKTLKQVQLTHWIWHGAGFVLPSQVAIKKFRIDLYPYLFCLPNFLYHDDGLMNFFIRNGVRTEFSRQDILSMLSSVKEKHESGSQKTGEELKRDASLCRFILEWLVEDGGVLSTDVQKKVMVPTKADDESLILKPCNECTFCDQEWLRQGGSDLDIPEECFLIDDLISSKTAKLLGLKPLSTYLMSGEQLEFGVELTGQNEPLTTRLSNILSDYKEGVGIFKELIQNADDAGATKVCFLIDWREGPRKSLFSPLMTECQGPALWSYNDAAFSDADFKNINKLAGKTKKEDLEKIGRFGLGFNAVYHLTDVPSFLSRQYLVIFDPNLQHLTGKANETHPGLRFDLAKNARPLKTFIDQFQPYHDVFHCNTKPEGETRFNYNGTLFRFPLRTETQAKRSKISHEVYDEKKVSALIASLRESLSVLMLYTQHVKEIQVYELSKTEDPKAMRLILSTVKCVESINLEQDCDLTKTLQLPFIKECSEWWKTNLSKTAASPSPSRSEMVTIQVKEQETEQKNEQWLVSCCMGTELSLQLAMNEGEKDGLLPCAGTAAKLSLNDTKPIAEAVLGEAFCFLPLSIATGLPLHVNSSFAVMNNRRNIWERTSSTQKQDLEVRWNESLMSDALCNAYIKLLETMKALCENGRIQKYLYHVLWPSNVKLKSGSWQPLVKNVYAKLVGNSLPLLRSNGRWLDINSGYILANDLREAPKVTEAMQCLNANVFQLPDDICTTLKECGQAETLQERTLTLLQFFIEFFFPNIKTLPHEVRNPLVLFGLDCIKTGQKELESSFKDQPSIPCSKDAHVLKKPSDLIDPRGAAAKLFFPEDNRFPTGEQFLTEDRVFVLEKLGMKKDLISWEEIYERARSVETLAESCYNSALQRSHNLISYLNKYLEDLPTLPHEEKTIQEIQFLPFIKEPLKENNCLPWKGLNEKTKRFCCPKELFLPRHMDLVSSCCLILSTHEKLGCGKPERNVQKVLGMSHKYPNHEQILLQLDNIVQSWSTFDKEDRKKNDSNVYRIIQKVYEYLEKHFAKMVKKTDEEAIDEGVIDEEDKMLTELAKREWLFIDGTFVFSVKVARNWPYNGAPYLYGLPQEYSTKYKSLLTMIKVKDHFEMEDFLTAINSLKESKGCIPVTDEELEIVVTFLKELNKADDTFLEMNHDLFYLPDHSKVLAKANELTINNTPWLPERGDSRSVHENITSGLAFKLGAKSLLDKRLGKYSKTFGSPFGQREKLTDRLKHILKSYPCDSGILKELVQNADDAQASEIHFIYDKRTLPTKKVFQKNAEEIQGPALCVFNNRAFSESDLEGIQKLGIGSKGDDAEKTGQFGIGFNAVYHLTDCPSFISDDNTLCILDPHCRYAPSATVEYPGERFDLIDDSFKDDFPDVMKGYLEEFGFDLRNSTMFRLPLRSEEGAQSSEICDKAGIKEIPRLLRVFKSEAKRSMLFLNHIKTISISEIDEDNNLTKKYEVTSNVEEEDMKKLAALHLHKKIIEDTHTKDIPWQGVTFPLVLSDTDKCIERWLVHQCYGVEGENEAIPDGRPTKLLPHGGIAARIDSNQRPTTSTEAPRYFAYCLLPLPAHIPLPVNVNGHFAIDPGRRDLWKDADSKYPLAIWNNMIKKNVLAPGYANLILEARKYMRFSEHEDEDKTTCFFPSKATAEAGLSWYHNLFPNVLDATWAPLTTALYSFLAREKKPVLPVVVVDKPNENEKFESMPRRIQRWLPVQDVLFVNKYRNPKDPEVTDVLINIFLDIYLPVAGYSTTTVQEGFEKSGFVARVVSPETVMLALHTFSSTNAAECKIGSLPCKIEHTTIQNESKLRKLIIYCRGEKFSRYLTGLPLLLTADGILRVFSEEQKAYCSKFSDLFPKRADKFVHPETISCLLSVLNIDRSVTTPESDQLVTDNIPTVLLHLTADVVATFMSDVFPESARDARVHLEFATTEIREEWLKRLWVYLQTYSKDVDHSISPLDALKAWPIIPTTSKKLVTVEMAKTVIDMTPVEKESDAMLKVRESLKKLNLPCLDTNITLPDEESRSESLLGTIVSSVTGLFTRSTAKKEPRVTVTESYVACAYNVADVLDVLDFMIETRSLNASDLQEVDFATILTFIQDGYEKIAAKPKTNEILKQLPFYKSINGKHYKLSDFSEYAVIPADVPTGEIEKLQEHTGCLFLHSDMLHKFEKLLTELDAGTKRSNAEFYRNYILPNYSMFSREMRFDHLTHIRDHVIPGLYGDPDSKSEFLNDLKRTRCIPNKNDTYVHASEFYDPRNEVLTIMEDESSNRFPPPPFNKIEWLEFLLLIGMINDIDQILFKKFASRVAIDGNSSPEDETNRKRSKTLLNLLFTNHHLHDPQFLNDISSVKFIASQKVEDVYLSLYKQHCCAENSVHPPFVQFSNAVRWKYRTLVWSSANLLPKWDDAHSHVCIENPECQIKNLYKNLQVKYPTLEMVVKHLQNISDVLAESSNRDKALPKNKQLKKIMNTIYEFLYRVTECQKPEITSECTQTCGMIGRNLANTQCILVPANDPKAVIKGNQLSFEIPADKSLVPFVYQVPWEYGKLKHLLKRLGATDSITPLQLVDVFKKMKNRVKDGTLNPQLKRKAQNAMYLLFQSVLKETKENKPSSLADVQLLYLPSVDYSLIKSSELLCEIPPRHIETIEKMHHSALCFFERCGLQPELEKKYLEALPAKLRPKPFKDIAKETLDESCLERPCLLCETKNDDCDFIKKLKVLLKSQEFKDGIIRLLKHQKDSNKLSQQDEQVASRFLNKVEIKCMEQVKVHLVIAETNEILEGSSTFRKSFVVERPDGTWTLYMKRGEITSSLPTSINKILDWKIRENLLLALSGMLTCTTPLAIPAVLNEHNIKVDAGKNDEEELGLEVPVVFHQLLQQNPLFVFYPGELVAYCTQFPNNVSSPIVYILAEIIQCVSANSAADEYDFEARYLINIGKEKKEVSVLDLYKFYQDYPDENSCRELVPFAGDVDKKPETLEEAKQEILKALEAAWRLPRELRRKAIHRLFLRWHPDKNPNNPEFAAEMMKFIFEEIKRMETKENRPSENPEDVNLDDIFQQCNDQATQDHETYGNYQSQSGGSFPSSSGSFPSSSRPSPSYSRPSSSTSSGSYSFTSMFRRTETYTVPNRAEAKRWIEQAEGDLSACKCLRSPRKPFDAMACFVTQQIVEKSLKAALYHECGLASEQLHTHDIYLLATNVSNLKRWRNGEVVSLALSVANYYLPTRYPNQLSYPKVPHNSFDGQSEHAIQSAEKILQLVKEFTTNSASGTI